MDIPIDLTLAKYLLTKIDLLDEIDDQHLSKSPKKLRREIIDRSAVYFPTTVSDINYLLMEHLDDADLLNLCQANTETAELCRNEYFWQRKLFGIFGDDFRQWKPENISFKQLYLDLTNPHKVRLLVALEYGIYPLIVKLFPDWKNIREQVYQKASLYAKYVFSLGRKLCNENPNCMHVFHGFLPIMQSLIRSYILQDNIILFKYFVDQNMLHGEKDVGLVLSNHRLEMFEYLIEYNQSDIVTFYNTLMIIIGKLNLKYENELIDILARHTSKESIIYCISNSNTPFRILRILMDKYQLGVEEVLDYMYNNNGETNIKQFIEYFDLDPLVIIKKYDLQISVVYKLVDRSNLEKVVYYAIENDWDTDVIDDLIFSYGPIKDMALKKLYEKHMGEQ